MIYYTLIFILLSTNLFTLILLACSRTDASTDRFTTLYNRRQFDLDMEQRKRKGDRYLVLIDMDGLKHINDRYGHVAGDNAIKQLAEALIANTRRNDRVYRIGGDEFAIISDSNAMCNRLPGNVSYGCAMLRYKNAFDIADRKLYKHKLSKNN